MNLYKDLMDAANLISSARYEIYITDGQSPAWDMLRHAGDRINEQAERELRGETQEVSHAA